MSSFFSQSSPAMTSDFPAVTVPRRHSITHGGSTVPRSRFSTAMSHARRVDGCSNTSVMREVSSRPAATPAAYSDSSTHRFKPQPPPPRDHARNLCQLESSVLRRVSSSPPDFSQIVKVTAKGTTNATSGSERITAGGIVWSRALSCEGESDPASSSAGALTLGIRSSVSGHEEHIGDGKFVTSSSMMNRRSQSQNGEGNLDSEFYGMNFIAPEPVIDVSSVHGTSSINSASRNDLQNENIFRRKCADSDDRTPHLVQREISSILHPTRSRPTTSTMSFRRCANDSHLPTFDLLCVRLCILHGELGGRSVTHI